jgi:hypothetical protein
MTTFNNFFQKLIIIIIIKLSLEHMKVVGSVRSRPFQPDLQVEEEENFDPLMSRNEENFEV